MTKRHTEKMTINGQPHDLEIETKKGYRGGVECTARITFKGTFTTIIYGDGGDYERTIVKKPIRATAKQIGLAHDAGMQHLDTVKSEIAAHYADAKNTDLFAEERGYISANDTSGGVSVGADYMETDFPQDEPVDALDDAPFDAMSPDNA